ncbi:MAG: ABC transporter permease, partial [Methylocystis sp.]
RVEPVRALPVRLRSAHHSRRVGLVGLSPDRQLLQLIDLKLRAASLPEDGVVLSKALAEVLEIGVGDLLDVETMEGERRVFRVRVADLLDEFSGSSAYMDLAALNRALREGATISGAFIAADPAAAGRLYATLKTTPRVASITSKRAALASFRQTVAENFLRMRIFNVIFGCIIAAGVVYNSARIALAERSRELATLRVIGFTRGEISTILLGEIGLLVVVAIPFGLIFGYGFAALATVALQTETQRFPLVVQPATYALAVTVVLLAALASGAIARRQLDRLDLVGVLKSRD